MWIHGVLVRDVQQRSHDLSPLAARCGSDRRTHSEISHYLPGHDTDIHAALFPALHARTVQFGSGHPHGAEKLQARLAQAIEDKFGVGPIEGYGVTECAPVIAVNCPDFRAAGYYQPASRRGTVGQPLPGVSVQIVDPDSYTPLPVGTPGMLLVKGPNVMNGYLGREDLTKQVLRNGGTSPATSPGWMRTGFSRSRTGCHASRRSGAKWFHMGKSRRRCNRPPKPIHRFLLSPAFLTTRRENGWRFCIHSTKARFPISWPSYRPAAFLTSSSPRGASS
ncbi:MAG: AMP-binding protein [Nitrospira sp.]|nr:AMP-binding protein [Nitrospira sp.]